MIAFGLSGGDKDKTVFISDIDSDLAELKWYALPVHKSFYVQRSYREGKLHTITIHRVIMERVLGRILESGETVDHINGNKMDNRRENLRLATRMENMWNRGITKNNTSGYKGVYWYKPRQKWRVSITANKKRIHLGEFDNIQDAVEAYAQGSKKYHGEFANTGK